MSRYQNYIQSTSSRNRFFIMAKKLEPTSTIINRKGNHKAIVEKKKRPGKKQTRLKKETIQSKVQIEKNTRNTII